VPTTLTLLLIGRLVGFLVMVTGMVMTFRAARGLSTNESDHPRLRKGIWVGIVGMTISSTSWLLRAIHD
jgi:hypothetical protein